MLVARFRQVLARPSLRHTAILAGAASLGQAIVLLAYPILTRQYEPAHFGILAVFVAILSSVLPIASFRFEFAVPLPRRDGDALRILGVALASAVATSLVTAIVVLLAGGRLLEAMNAPGLSPYLWILPLGLWAAATYQALTYWAIRTKSFPRLASTRLLQSVTTVAVQVGAGLLHVGALGLIAGHAFGQAASAIRLAAGVTVWNRQMASYRHLRRVRWITRRYRRFALLSAPASLLNTLAFSVPPIALTILYGPAVAGWFALADRAIAVPLGIVTNSIGQVYVASAARLAVTDPVALRRRYLSLSLTVLLLAGLPLALVAAFGPQLFALVFGDAWMEAGSLARTLALLYLARSVVNPLSQTLNLLERQGRMLALDSLRAIAVALVFLAAGHLALTAPTTVAWYGFAMTASYASYWWVGLHAIGQRLPPSTVRSRGPS